MAMKILAKVLNVEESGGLLPRSGVSSLGKEGTLSTCDDELASLSNPMLSDCKVVARPQQRGFREMGVESFGLSEIILSRKFKLEMKRSNEEMCVIQVL